MFSGGTEEEYWLKMVKQKSISGQCSHFMSRNLA